VTTFDGLPAHPLLVHAVVVLIPLAAVLLVLIAVWPAARRRFTVLTAILAALALISVPITTDAGDWLEHHVPRTPLVHAHTHLGDAMLPWAIALFIVTAAITAREILRARATTRTASHIAADAIQTPPPTSDRASSTPRPGLGGPVTSIVLAVLAVAVALGSIITVYRIGESGARAAWTGHFTAQANPPRPHHTNG
jgi:hypothetical protein